MLDSWSAAEDSEVEAEKAKIAAEKKAKADAEAAASKKSKTQRVAEKLAARKRAEEEEEDDTSSSEEDEGTKRERLRRTEQDADLQHAEDLIGDIGISSKRSAAPRAIVHDSDDPEKVIDLSALSLFHPTGKDGFTKLRETLVPILSASAKKAQYTIFLQDLTKQLAKDLPSEQIKKIASVLTTLGNEKMKEEKAAEKGGKKSKAQKTKTSLVASRDVAGGRDTTAYDDDGLDDG